MNKKEQDQLDALITENVALKTELDALKAAPAASNGVQLADAANAFQTRYAKEIKAKIAAGLDRAQAIEAQVAQVRADAAAKK